MDAMDAMPMTPAQGTDPTIPPAEKRRVQANVAKMRVKGASEQEIAAYLQGELAHFTAAPGAGDRMADRMAAPTAFAGVGPMAAESTDTSRQTTGTPRTGSFLGGLARSGEQGLTFGFGDEINAGARALFTDQTYEQAVGDERRKLQEFRDDHPVLATGAELAGALAPALLTGGASAGASAAEMGGTTLGRQALRLGAQGAKLGALYGAGAANGLNPDDPTAPKDFLHDVLSLRRVGGAVGGAVAGGLTGAAMPAIGRGGAALARRLGLLSEAAPQTEGRLLTSALARGGHTPDQAAADLAAHPELRVADLSDPTRKLARYTVGKQGAAGDQLAAEVEGDFLGQHDALRAHLQRAFGMSEADVGALEEALKKQAQQNARPLYEQAYAHGAVDDPEINGILGLPYINRAYRRALNIAEAERVPLPTVFKEVERASPLLGADGTPQMVKALEAVQTPDVRTLDYVKRGLDDLLLEGKLSPEEQRAVGQLRETLVKRLDGQVPAYRAARAQYAGDIEMRDALQLGKAAVTKTHQQIARELADLGSEEARRMYRLAYLQEKLARLDNVSVTRDVTKGYSLVPAEQKRLEVILPDPAARQAFEENLATMGRQARTHTMMNTGSRTAPMGQEAAAYEEEMGALPRFVKHGAKPFREKLGDALEARQRGITAQVAEGVAKAMNMKGPAAAAYLKTLQPLSDADRQYLLQAIQSTRVGSRVTGLTAGRQFSPNYLLPSGQQ